MSAGAALADRILQMTEKLRATNPHSPVTLADLRPRLPSSTREDQDRVLLELLDSGRINLTASLLSAQSLVEEIRSAAIHVSGEDRHFISVRP